MNTDKPDDPTLMAFADGTLDPPEHARIDALVRADPQLAKEVEAYRLSREALQGALDAPLSEPIPPRLLATITRSIAASRAPAIVGQPARRPLRQAFTAVTALAAAAVLGFVARGPEAADLGLLAGFAQEGSVLTRALDEASTGRAYTLAQGTQLTPALSFADREGRMCREFAAQTSETRSQGVACRTPTGWQLEVLVASAPVTAGSSPASAGEPAELAAALQRLGASAPLDAAQETCARKAAWGEAARRCVN